MIDYSDFGIKSKALSLLITDLAFVPEPFTYDAINQYVFQGLVKKHENIFKKDLGFYLKELYKKKIIETTHSFRVSDFTRTLNEFYITNRVIILTAFSKSKFNFEQLVNYRNTYEALIQHKDTYWYNTKGYHWGSNPEKVIFLDFCLDLTVKPSTHFKKELSLEEYNEVIKILFTLTFRDEKDFTFFNEIEDLQTYLTLLIGYCAIANERRGIHISRDFKDIFIKHEENLFRLCKKKKRLSGQDYSQLTQVYLLAIERFIFEGNAPASEELLKQLESLINDKNIYYANVLNAKATLAFLQGQIEEARQFFNQAQSFKKKSKGKFVEAGLNYWPYWCFLLTQEKDFKKIKPVYTARNVPEDYQQTHLICKIWYQERLLNKDAAEKLINEYTQTDYSPNHALALFFLEVIVFPHDNDRLKEFLETLETFHLPNIAYWLALKITKGKDEKEITTLINKLQDKADFKHAPHAIDQQEQWEEALDVLLMLSEGEAMKKEADTQITWEVEITEEDEEEMSLKAKVQKLGKSGKWSKSRVV